MGAAQSSVSCCGERKDQSAASNLEPQTSTVNPSRKNGSKKTADEEEDNNNGIEGEW